MYIALSLSLSIHIYIYIYNSIFPRYGRRRALPDRRRRGRGGRLRRAGACAPPAAHPRRAGLHPRARRLQPRRGDARDAAAARLEATVNDVTYYYHYYDSYYYY